MDAHIHNSTFSSYNYFSSIFVQNLILSDVIYTILANCPVLQV